MPRGQDTRFNLKRRITKLTSALDDHTSYRQERQRQDDLERRKANEQSMQGNTNE